MNRRTLIGLLILVIAVAGALAGNARTKTVAGAARPAPIPGPPAVGDCVVDEPDNGGVYAEAQDGTRSYQVLTFGPCAAKIAEVTAVVPGGMRFKVRYGADGVPVTSPGSPDPFDQCWDSAVSYLGLPADYFSANGSGWQKNWSIDILAGQPDPLQQTDGQDWVVCAARPAYRSGDEPYADSLRGSFNNHRYPAQLATCTHRPTDPVESQGTWPTACDHPHLSEQFATRLDEHPDRRSSAGYRAECEQLIRSMTGMVDPTAGGLLRIGIDAEPVTVADGEGDAALRDVTAVQYTCQLEAGPGRQLTGPLMGLGGGPVPVR